MSLLAIFKSSGAIIVHCFLLKSRLYFEAASDPVAAAVFEKFRIGQRVTSSNFFFSTAPASQIEKKSEQLIVKAPPQ